MGFLIGCAVVVAMAVGIVCWAHREQESRRTRPRYLPDRRGRMVRVEPGTTPPDTETPVHAQVVEAVREVAYEARLTAEQRAARRAVRRLRDEVAWLKKRPFSDRYDDDNHTRRI